VFFGFVLFLTQVWGYSTLNTGLAITPGPLLVVAIAPLAGRMADVRGHRILLFPRGILLALGGSTLRIAYTTWLLIAIVASNNRAKTNSTRPFQLPVLKVKEQLMQSNKNLAHAIDSLLQDAYPPTEPGAAVIVVRDGQIILRQGYGMANLELGVPIEPDMVFRLGSITKQFTAVSILLLLEQGKLALDDPITKFLPDYPTHDHLITVEHLLTHTSGIRNYSSPKSVVKNRDMV